MAAFRQPQFSVSQPPLVNVSNMPKAGRTSIQTKSSKVDLQKHIETKNTASTLKFSGKDGTRSAKPAPPKAASPQTQDTQRDQNQRAWLWNCAPHAVSAEREIIEDPKVRRRSSGLA